MNNPIDYLWYKMYKMSFYTREPYPTVPMVTLLFVNSYTICLVVFGMDVASFGTSILLIILCSFIAHPYTRYKKKRKIIRKYYNESEKSRIRGNIIVTVYVILSFVVVFLVAKYHITIQNIL
ncbi:MAG: hypothetical protein LBS69_06570 [Prevotellaceae bacterium]|jgi:hypothetical protein|nr:hypothetical protein [Prevotellaceae bacterium]